MKRVVKNVQVLGAAVLSPALMGQPQAAAARSIDRVGAVQIESGCPANDPSFDSAKAGLAFSIFGMGLDEKLKIAGSNIPRIKLLSSKKFAIRHRYVRVAVDACDPTNHGLIMTVGCRRLKGSNGRTSNSQVVLPHTPAPHPHFHVPPLPRVNVK